MEASARMGKGLADFVIEGLDLFVMDMIRASPGVKSPLRSIFYRVEELLSKL